MIDTLMVSREAPFVSHIQPSVSASVSWLMATALVGWAGCGFNSKATGGGGIIDASVDAQEVDAMIPPIDAPPGVTCYGPPGWQACFTSAPSGTFNLPGMINTDGGSPCANTQPMGWGAPQPAACFIIRDKITVPSGGTNVSGRKPLVLIAGSSITVTGVLDVASHRGDTGTPPGECQAFNKVPNVPATGVGGGGGAGGSFITRAGNGGSGDGGSQNGQASSADTTAPTHLRGGCPGQAGGAAQASDAGLVGLGGGSVYLISGGDIALQKSINASGAGGGGGDHRAGGSGGGSGGMIVLYGATITIPAPPAPAPVLMANGGGGGGGSTGNQATSGTDPSIASPLTPATGGGTNGGKGYSVTVVNPNDLDGTGGASGTGDGGGGGGGAAGYIRSNKTLVGAIVSPMADIVP